MRKRGVFRQSLRLVLLTGAGLLLLVVFGAGPFLLQDAPALEASPPPSSQDVAATRQFVRDIRSAADSGTLLQVDEAQLNSAIRLGARFIDGFRARVTVNAADVTGVVSIPVRWWTGPKWLNVTGRVPPFQERFILSHITVGPNALPPALAAYIARTGANIALGNRFGDRVFGAASAMSITADRLTFRMQLDDTGKNGLMRGTFGAMRGQQMPAFEEIEAYHLLIRAAMAEGKLQQSGSFLPYLRFTLAAALEHSTPETLPNAYTAAIFGLTKVCGARDFAMIVGQLGFMETEAAREWDTSCHEVTFSDRIDSRRHFITSAALQAASNTGFSVSVGEFKELYDIISGAGGYDFTDIAANLSGVRLSDRFMTAPLEMWPDLLERLETENDVIVPFDGIPQLLPEAQFKAKFGDVDSAPYKEMLAQIQARIDRLTLHRP